MPHFIPHHLNFPKGVPKMNSKDQKTKIIETLDALVTETLIASKPLQGTLNGEELWQLAILLKTFSVAIQKDNFLSLISPEKLAKVKTTD